MREASRDVLASRVLETSFLVEGIGGRDRGDHKIASLFSTLPVLLESQQIAGCCEGTPREAAEFGRPKNEMTRLPQA